MAQHELLPQLFGHNLCHWLHFKDMQIVFCFCIFAHSTISNWGLRCFPLRLVAHFIWKSLAKVAGFQQQAADRAFWSSCNRCPHTDRRTHRQTHTQAVINHIIMWLSFWNLDLLMKCHLKIDLNLGRNYKFIQTLTQTDDTQTDDTHRLATDDTRMMHEY